MCFDGVIANADQPAHQQRGKGMRFVLAPARGYAAAAAVVLQVECLLS
jgi:hypothetical protein